MPKRCPRVYEQRVSKFKRANSHSLSWEAFLGTWSAWSLWTSEQKDGRAFIYWVPPYPTTSQMPGGAWNVSAVLHSCSTAASAVKRYPHVVRENGGRGTQLGRQGRSGYPLTYGIPTDCPGRPEEGCRMQSLEGELGWQVCWTRQTWIESPLRPLSISAFSDPIT